MSTAIVDIGLGNALAFKNMFRKTGLDCNLVSKPDQINNSHKNIILVGNGAFDDYIASLKSHDFYNFFKNTMNYKNKKLLGICIGAHVMGYSSSEGKSKGLGLLNFKVNKISKNDKYKFQKTNMGVQNITWENNAPKELMKCKKFYFLHSYVMRPNDNSIVLASSSEYKFAAVCAKDNIYAIQFHPEKSNKEGMYFFKRFVSINL